MARVHEGMAQHGMAVFTDTQTQGRGQREKQWFSEPGANIALSLILKPSLHLSRFPFHLSMIAATALHRFFSKWAPHELSIKWPNDLYYRDRKAAGILVEGQWQGPQWNWAVVGMGVNINQVDFPALMGKPVSLKQITGKTYVPLTLATQLRDGVLDELEAYESNPAACLEYYQAHLYRRDQSQKFKKGSLLFEARILGVNDAGQLLVQRGQIEEALSNGEVQYVI